MNRFLDTSEPKIQWNDYIKEKDMDIDLHKEDVNFYFQFKEIAKDRLMD